MTVRLTKRSLLIVIFYVIYISLECSVSLTHIKKLPSGLDSVFSFGFSSPPPFSL